MCPFDWASVEKESIWKVRSWIWPLSPEFWPVEPEPSLKPNVSTANHSHTLYNQFVMFLLTFRCMNPIFKIKCENRNLSNFGTLTSNTRWTDNIPLKQNFLWIIKLCWTIQTARPSCNNHQNHLLQKIVNKRTKQNFETKSQFFPIKSTVIYIGKKWKKNMTISLTLAARNITVRAPWSSG